MTAQIQCRPAPVIWLEPEPQTVPVALAATALTASGFTANWSAAAGATSYRLDVSTSNTFSSFVSGFNGLNVGNVTAYAVTGLAAGTSYYFRLRAVGFYGTSGNSNTVTTTTATAYDSEVLDWIARVIANGSNVSAATKDAANAFMVTIKARAGLRAKILRLNLYAGNDKLAVVVPLIKDYGDNALDFWLGSSANFSYTETGASGGLRLINAASAPDALSTNLWPSSVGSDNDFGFGAYVRNKDGLCLFGSAQTSFNTSDYIYLDGGSTSYFAIHSNSNDVTVADSTQTGFYLVTRDGSGAKAYRNGTLLGSNAAPGGNRSGYKMFMHQGNLGPTGGGWPGSATNRYLAGYQQTLALDAGDVTTISGAWLTFQTALSRL